MKIKEFGYYVEEHIREFLPEDRRESAEVSVHPKKKVNDTLRYGLAIRFDSDKISPVLYLEDAWQAYENGADMETVQKALKILGFPTYVAHRGNRGCLVPGEKRREVQRNHEER